MNLQKGRPATGEGRLEKELRTYDLLDRVGVEYWRVDHAPAYTMEACGEVDKVLGTRMCKNLFLCNRQNTDFYLLLIPDGKVFKTRELSHQIGSSRLSFGTAEDMERYLDITPGAVSVLGLMNDKDNAVKLLVDEDVLADEYLGCHPCVNTSSLKLRTQDVFGPVLAAMHHDMTVVKLVGEQLNAGGIST